MDSSDAALVAAVLRGDQAAFTRLCRRHRAAHMRFAVRMLGDRFDADEALQSAWLRVFRHLDRCANPERFAAWSFAIVANECRSALARRGRREARLVNDEAALDAVSLESDAEHGMVRDDIERALSALEPEQREAFLLKHVEQLRYDEMAEITGVGVSALKMRVKRACERLRELLEGVSHA
jgi:RNA polymerase sigma-70 factor, ECF subfamily